MSQIAIVLVIAATAIIAGLAILIGMGRNMADEWRKMQSEKGLDVNDKPLVKQNVSSSVDR